MKLVTAVVMAMAVGVPVADAAREGPVLIIRDTGGIAEPDLDFNVWPDLSWTFAGRGQQAGNRKGKLVAAELQSLADRLNKAGLAKAKSIQPNPAPHSQVMVHHRATEQNIFLEREGALMCVARKLVLDVVFDGRD